MSEDFPNELLNKRLFYLVKVLQEKLKFLGNIKFKIRENTKMF